MADPNIIVNGDFSAGIEPWSPNGCKASLATSESSSGVYVVVTNRNASWQGLEQDITTRISPGITYTVSACVTVSDSAKVLATARLEYKDSSNEYLSIGKTYASKDKWVDLKGTFSISNQPDRIVLYLEGPASGIDLLICSVIVIDSTSSNLQRGSAPEADHHISLNSSFSDDHNHWYGNGCNIMLHESLADGKIKPHSGTRFASATKRTDKWSGIAQDITKRVHPKLVYEVSSFVRLSRNNHTVEATLSVKYLDKRKQYISISRLGSLFSLPNMNLSPNVFPDTRVLFPFIKCSGATRRLGTVKRKVSIE